MEHRQAQREPAEIMVLLSTADGVTRKGQIKNLSSLGAGVVIDSGSMARGTIVDIRMPPTDPRQRTSRLRSRGYVVRVQDKEFGLLWISEEAMSPFLNGRDRPDDAQSSELLIA